jgi:hypothetical protein
MSGYYDKDRAEDNVAGRIQGYPSPGLNTVNEYLISGRPWLETRAVSDAAVNVASGAIFEDVANKFEFPFVARRVVVKSNTGALIVSLCSLNVLDADDEAEADSAVLTNKNYYVVSAGSELELNIKCRRIYVSGHAGAADTSVFAELTGIVHDYDLDVDDIAGVSG